MSPRASIALAAMPDLNQIIAFCTVATVLASAIAIFVTLRSVREQLWLQTFSEYTRRYNEIVKSLPSAARARDSAYDLSALDARERGEVLNAARSYINLCSERALSLLEEKDR